MEPVTNSEEVLVISDHCRNGLIQLSTNFRPNFGYSSVHIYDLLKSIKPLMHTEIWAWLAPWLVLNSCNMLVFALAGSGDPRSPNVKVAMLSHSIL
jgi:hypothetical protein